MKYISNKLNSLKKFLSSNNTELVMLLGAFFIVYATFLVNFIAGLYIVGILLIALSLFMLRFPRRR